MDILRIAFKNSAEEALKKSLSISEDDKTYQHLRSF